MKKSVTISTMILLMSALAWSDVPQSQSPGEGTEGHGGDPTEPLFIDAQKRVSKLLGRIQKDQIKDLQIEQKFKTWLATDNRLASLQGWVDEMTLEFKEGACVENEIAKPVCYDDTDPGTPKMYVVPSLNRETTPNQAAALVIHEAGHLAGERRHKFLSALGAELVNKADRPKLPPQGEELENGGVYGNMFADEVFLNTDGSVTFVEPRVKFNGNVERKIFADWSHTPGARGLDTGDLNSSSPHGVCLAFGYSNFVDMSKDTQSGTRNFVSVNKDGAVVGEVSWKGTYPCTWDFTPNTRSSDDINLPALCKVRKFYINSITCE